MKDREEKVQTLIAVFRSVLIEDSMIVSKALLFLMSNISSNFPRTEVSMDDV